MQKIVKFMWILALAIICYGSAYADQICEIPPLETSPVARIEGRSFPSIIQAWDHLIGSTQEFDTFGYIYDEPLHTERITKHDLYFSPPFALWWNIMPTETALRIDNTARWKFRKINSDASATASS